MSNNHIKALKQDHEGKFGLQCRMQERSIQSLSQGIDSPLIKYTEETNTVHSEQTRLKLEDKFLLP